MSAYFKVDEANVLMRSKTNHNLGGVSFIVYVSSGKKDIRVNTFFREESNSIYNCCSYYDRKLCDTIEAFEKMSTAEIENQAYGANMDGGRL